MHDQSSPIETPTTPPTPSFPLFAPSPTLSHSRHTSIASIQTILPARRCSFSPPTSNTTPISTGHSIPIIRPLPLRPALQSNSNRISKPSQQHQQPRRSSRSRGRSPSPTHSQRPPLIRTISPRRGAPPLTYTHALSHLTTSLIPLISVTTGRPHPAFPRSLLQYHLLTHAQLDALAVYYHQVVPAVRETGQYPVAIPAWVDRDGEEMKDGNEAMVGLETKRRRWGRFLGLRGCESPTRDWADESRQERGMRERLEREWRRGIERRREEERLRGKVEGWKERW